MRSLLVCSALVVLASWSFGESGKPTIEAFQEESESRILSEEQAQGEDMRAGELEMLAVNSSVLGEAHHREHRGLREDSEDGLTQRREDPKGNLWSMER